jgi:hypothetical protein
MKRDWLVMSGLLMAVGIILYFYWDRYRRPVCEDVASAPWMQGTAYDSAMGQCEESK